MQLCESLEELLNVNGELRSQGQTVWTLLGNILGQVRPDNRSAYLQTVTIPGSQCPGISLCFFPSFFFAFSMGDDFPRHSLCGWF